MCQVHVIGIINVRNGCLRRLSILLRQLRASQTGTDYGG